MDLLKNTWELTAVMAPYLLLGFGVAGLIRLAVKREVVERFLGRPGIGGVVRASIAGVPMPLCSCSVIPVAASLREQGASKGATASFLSSTPQTGVDSILATLALLGGTFTAVRVAVAFLSGVVAGMLVDLFSSRRERPVSTPEEQATATPEVPDFGGMQFSPTAEEDEAAPCCGSAEPTSRIGGTLRYGFIRLPADLAFALTIGLLLAGLVATFLPHDLLAGNLSDGLPAFALATLVGLPLYVCATGSIPMAYAFLAAGLSPGAALVFLIMGPATNTATIVTVIKMLGKRAALIYLLALGLVSWCAGFLVNLFLSDAFPEAEALGHSMETVAGWQHLSGILLVGLLVAAKLLDRKAEAASCCAS